MDNSNSEENKSQPTESLVSEDAKTSDVSKEVFSELSSVPDKPAAAKPTRFGRFSIQKVPESEKSTQKSKSKDKSENSAPSIKDSDFSSENHPDSQIQASQKTAASALKSVSENEIVDIQIQVSTDTQQKVCSQSTIKPDSNSSEESESIKRQSLSVEKSQKTMTANDLNDKTVTTSMILPAVSLKLEDIQKSELVQPKSVQQNQQSQNSQQNQKTLQSQQSQQNTQVQHVQQAQHQQQLHQQPMSQQQLIMHHQQTNQQIQQNLQNQHNRTQGAIGHEKSFKILGVKDLYEEQERSQQSGNKLNRMITGNGYRDSMPQMMLTSLESESLINSSNHTPSSLLSPNATSIASPENNPEISPFDKGPFPLTQVYSGCSALGNSTMGSVMLGQTVMGHSVLGQADFTNTELTSETQQEIDNRQQKPKALTMRWVGKEEDQSTIGKRARWQFEDVAKPVNQVLPGGGVPGVGPQHVSTPNVSQPNVTGQTVSQSLMINPTVSQSTPNQAIQSTNSVSEANTQNNHVSQSQTGTVPGVQAHNTVIHALNQTVGTQNNGIAQNLMNKNPQIIGHNVGVHAHFGGNIHSSVQNTGNSQNTVNHQNTGTQNLNKNSQNPFWQNQQQTGMGPPQTIPNHRQFDVQTVPSKNTLPGKVPVQNVQVTHQVQPIPGNTAANGLNQHNHAMNQQNHQFQSNSAARPSNQNQQQNPVQSNQNQHISEQINQQMGGPQRILHMPNLTLSENTSILNNNNQPPPAASPTAVMAMKPKFEIQQNQPQTNSTDNMSKKETSGKTGHASGQNNLHNGALNNGQIMQKPQGLQHNLPQNNVSSGNPPQNNAQVQNNVQNVIPQNIPQKHGQQSSIPKNTILQNGTQQTQKQQLPPKPAVLSVQQPQKVPLQSNVNPSLDKSQNLGQNLSQNQGQNKSQNTGQNSHSIQNSVQNSQTGVQVAQVNQNIGQNTQNIQNTAHYNHINTQNNLQKLPTNQKHATISTQPPKQFAKVPMNEVTGQKPQQLIQPQVIQKVPNQQTTPQNNLQNNLQHNIQNNLQNNKVHTLPSNPQPQPTNAPPQVSATPVLPTTDSREAILRLVDENSSSFKARLQVLMENLSMSSDNQHLEEKSRLKKEKGELESKNKKQSTKIKRLEFENNQLRERVTFLENQLNTLDGADGADGGRSGNDGSDQEDQT